MPPAATPAVKAHGEKLFKQLVKKCVADGEITPEESEQLRDAIAGIKGVTPESTSELIAQAREVESIGDAESQHKQIDAQIADGRRRKAEAEALIPQLEHDIRAWQTKASSMRERAEKARTFRAAHPWIFNSPDKE